MMKINSLNLLNYRNYSQIKIDLHSKMTLIIGDNAQGKTNLLEAIYFLSTLRSFRTQNDRDLIKIDEDYFRIQCDVTQDETKKTAQVVVFKNGKSIKINETVIRRSSDYIGFLNCVIFSPQDLNFFSDSPRVRRKFIDIEATKVSTTYLGALNRYFELLKQRNALLKQPQIDDDVLMILTKQLVDELWIIVNYRLKMIHFINKHCQPIFEKLSTTPHQIEIIYQTEIETDDENEFKQLMMERMKQNKVRDIYFKVTHSGCHRDDLSAKMDGFDLNQIASQGQKRLVLIALKLALIEFISKETSNTPILLLDDVFSELDETHQQRFLQHCPTDSQIVLTTTSINQIDSITSDYYVYEINQGQIEIRRD